MQLLSSLRRLKLTAIMRPVTEGAIFGSSAPAKGDRLFAAEVIIIAVGIRQRQRAGAQKRPVVSNRNFHLGHDSSSSQEIDQRKYIAIPSEQCPAGARDPVNHSTQSNTSIGAVQNGVNRG